MSAMITVERRTSEERVAYVDSVGRALCTSCQHKRGEVAEQCRPGDIGGPIGAAFPACDFCGCNLLVASVETISGMAVIEHVACKIF